MKTPMRGLPRDDYNDLVRRCFADPAHGGELPAGPGRVVRSRAEEGGAGARIELEARMDDDRIRRLCFRVFGCPHLIAAAELACERFEGTRLPELTPFPKSELMQRLGIPVEKTGRLLCLEDAFERLRENCEAAG
ncbi:MAG: iron-sulfur cluster assembly scaffold protein [Woeseiaceae bacterium]|nr:iron-sulfur cluster assembly scaffold protein [Woeseiaceae bacterium]